MNRLLISTACSLLLFACNRTKDAEDIYGSLPTTASARSIAYVKSLYKGYPYRLTEDYLLNGVVVANDYHGNFYKVLVVRDSTAGIEIRADVEDIYKDYFIGDSVTVYCNSLTVGAYGGLIQLGASPADGREVGLIDEYSFRNRVVAHGYAPEYPEAVALTLENLSPEYLSCRVKVCDVQFPDDCLGRCWCENDSVTVRTLVDRFDNELDVRTSHHADFANLTIPSGSGYVCGILSVFNNRYQLIVENVNYLDMSGRRF